MGDFPRPVRNVRNISMNLYEIVNAVVAVLGWMRWAPRTTEGTPKAPWRIVAGCACEGCEQAREYRE